MDKYCTEKSGLVNDEFLFNTHTHLLLLTYFDAFLWTTDQSIPHPRSRLIELVNWQWTNSRHYCDSLFYIM